ncbi:hypothetical protein TWF694_000303 [Orbilia ellipsospora]|uniref:Pectate lyase domain-containing protein n=1 Tax=Orbilia ellipsospora TaxID=2528407 RepID=A0AAV9XNJ3_9PEZI
MYGEAHIYNNYYNSPGNNYCIGFGSYGSVLIENNYFKGVKNPHYFMYDWYVYAAASGDTYDTCTGTKDTGVKGSTNVAGQESYSYPPVKVNYSYSLDSAANIPALVQSCAGPSPSPSAAVTTTKAGATTATTKATITPASGGSCNPTYYQCGGLAGLVQLAAPVVLATTLATIILNVCKGLRRDIVGPMLFLAFVNSPTII